MEGREYWLNGWKRDGDGVFIGMKRHCIGCGRNRGVVPVGHVPKAELPTLMPDWPFEEGSCPICNLRGGEIGYMTVEELAMMPEDMLSKALDKVRVRRTHREDPG